MPELPWELFAPAAVLLDVGRRIARGQCVLRARSSGERGPLARWRRRPAGANFYLLAARATKDQSTARVHFAVTQMNPSKQVDRVTAQNGLARRGGYPSAVEARRAGPNLAGARQPPETNPTGLAPQGRRTDRVRGRTARVCARQGGYRSLKLTKAASGGVEIGVR